MMIRQLSSFGLVLTLSGCAGLAAINQYAGVPVLSFKNEHDTWRVFDKPAEGRLMITPSIGRSAGVGLANGLTFGAAGDLPKPLYEQAAQGWLASTGRECRITDGYVLARPQWEFKYSCSVASVPMRPDSISDAGTPSHPIGLGIIGETIKRGDTGPAAYLSDPYGVWVDSVMTMSPAARAGIMRADIIQTFNGHRVLSFDELNNYVAETIPGNTIHLGVFRNRQLIFIDLDLQSQSAN